MTKREAKRITIKVWTHLAEHPEIARKEDLPINLYDEINSFIADCPLCELFYRKDCEGCPLYNVSKSTYCAGVGEVYGRWVNAKEEKTREESASAIVAKVRAWKV